MCTACASERQSSRYSVRAAGSSSAFHAKRRLATLSRSSAFATPHRPRPASFPRRCFPAVGRAFVPAVGRVQALSARSCANLERQLKRARMEDATRRGRH
jgi:hypothetical protein